MNNLSDFIRQKREDMGISRREFARMCGLSHTYVDMLERGFDPRNNKPVSPTIDTLKKIAESINYNLIDLLNESGFVTNDIIIESSSKLSEKDIEELSNEIKTII